MKKTSFPLNGISIALIIIIAIAVIVIPSIAASNQAKEHKANANKALSVLADALKMRNSLEGVAPANFQGSIGQYFLQPMSEYAYGGTPKADEQAVLPATFISVGAVSTRAEFKKNSGPDTHLVSATFNEGMIVGFPAKAANDRREGGCSNLTVGCFITVDTNGVKGPTRTLPGRIPGASGSGTTRIFEGTLSGASGKKTGTITSNSSPDIITIKIRDTIVEAGDQRTVNILTTGNAMKAR